MEVIIEGLLVQTDWICSCNPKSRGLTTQAHQHFSWENKWLCKIIWAATWQNQSECAHQQDSDQPGHPPGLIRVFAVSLKKAWVLSYPLSAQRRLWSDWAAAQADLSLHWVHSHSIGFVMSWPILDILFKVFAIFYFKYTLRPQYDVSNSMFNQYVTDYSRRCGKWSIDVTPGQSFTNSLDMETNVNEFLVIQYYSAIEKEGRLQHTVVQSFVIISLKVKWKQSVEPWNKSPSPTIGALDAEFWVSGIMPQLEIVTLASYYIM